MMMLKDTLKSTHNFHMSTHKYTIGKERKCLKKPENHIEEIPVQFIQIKLISIAGTCVTVGGS